jgi:uncharacterized repeat protein (TIGR01451 family)
MTHPSDTLKKLVHHLGVAGPARVRAFKGTSAPWRTLTLTPLLALIAFSVSTGPAQAEAEVKAPGWEVTSTTYPTNLAPSGGTGTIELNVFNIGAAPSTGTVTVTDVLPKGVVATEAGDVQTSAPLRIGGAGLWDCSIGTVVTCTNNQERLPSLPIPQPQPKEIPGDPGNFGPVPRNRGGGAIEHIGIAVTVQMSETGTLENHVSVAGGGAPAPAGTVSSITVSPVPAQFGVQDVDGWVSNADGTLDTRAGSHPYELTFNLDFRTIFNNGNLEPAGDAPRNVQVNLPPGLVGNPTAVPECSRQAFEEEVCPPATQVGIDKADGLGGTIVSDRFPFPVYNLIPPPGVPAQFAFQIFGVVTYLDAGVRSGGDYGLTAHVDNIAQKTIMGNTIILWGEPADPSHNEDRFSKLNAPKTTTAPEVFQGCLEGCASEGTKVPFLTLATSCEGPQSTSVTMTGWRTSAFAEASFLSHDANFAPAGLTGCDQLGFNPTISLAPDTTSADTPAGLTVDVRVPQEGLVTPGALATSNIKDTVVAFPAGMVINPGQAAGLQACQQGPTEESSPGVVLHPGRDNLPLAGENGEEQKFEGPPDCPNASKVGTIQIATPLLKEDLEGDVYVLQSNPPHLKLLFAASGEGVNLKLVAETSLCERAGEEIDGKTCEAAGQLISRLSETPELPFTNFKLSLSGGAQAALDTPTRCGTFTGTSDFTPWSTLAVADVFSSSNLAITSGPDGSACPAGALPFDPALTAGSTTDQAGGFTSFSLLLQSADGQQRIEKLRFQAPQGLSGVLASVPLCPEPQAVQGTCSAASQIGHSTVASGPGPYPLTIPQPGDPESPIYLTGPYEGAPFGLSIVTHVIAGPFNLGNVITRARIEVDPHTAQIMVTTDPLPQIIDGVPTDLRLVDAVIDRPGFMINPTNCDPASFSGTATGAPPPGTSGSGSTAPISSHFGVGSCQSLKFAPKFAVSTAGKTSKANGASLHVKLTYPSGTPGTYANIHSVKVELPKALPSRLTTLQKACTAAQFEANPAGCPAASVIGHAKAITPILPVPLEGPAYFVSHGGEAFPSLIIVLQGYGVTLDLVGTTFISKSGITSSTFKTVPDQPVGSFELTLPQGKFSALAANGNLCSLTHIVTTKKKVTERVRGKLVKVTKKTSKRVAEALKMPTEFVGQNGLVIHQSTAISVTGCVKAKPAKKLVKKHKQKKATTNRRARS